MLIEGVKLSDGTILPLAVDDSGKLIISGDITIGDITLDNVEIANDSGNPVPVNGTVALGAGTAAIGKLTAAPGLDIPSHDAIALSYTDGNLTGVVYSLDGDTVATLTLAYTDGNLTSVTKS